MLDGIQMFRSDSSFACLPCASVSQPPNQCWSGIGYNL